MNKINILLAIILFIFTVGNIHAVNNNVGFFGGLIYNPVNSDYIMGTLGATFVLSGRNVNNSSVYDFRYSYGIINYRYEAPNPFTVQQEITKFWSRGGIFEFGINAMYQYSIKEKLGIRIGGGISMLYSGVFLGNKPGKDINSPLVLNMGFNGIAGVSMFLDKKFPVFASVSPGFIFDPYADRGIGIIFLMPVTLTVSVLLL